MSPSSETGAERSLTTPLGVLIHTRTAGALVRAAACFDARITLKANGRTASATSILEILALGVRGGTELSLSASGEDAPQAVSSLAGLIVQLASPAA